MKTLILLLLCCGFTVTAMAADNGLLRKASPHSVAKTVDLFEAAVRAKGMMVFPRIDHAAAANAYGLAMRPAVVVSFGNPTYGTPFMRQAPEAGIDFPPKAIVYEDRAGKVWIGYNSAAYLYETLFARHGLTYPPDDQSFYENVLEALTDAAVDPHA